MAVKVEPAPVAVIMAGGSGTRFWPLSQKSLPKQYLKLVGEKSLIQETVERVKLVADPNDIFICSGESQRPLIDEQLPEVRGLILEPEARNTAPCLMLSVEELLRKGYAPETPMLVFPADHFIGNPEKFQSLLIQAIEFARQHNALVTMGVVPTSPHTGYGYIEAATTNGTEGIFRATRFLEKPSLEKAQAFIQDKNFYWNSGIFIWTLKAISEAFARFLPQEWKMIHDHESGADLRRVYSTLKSQPIDTAIMEKADNVYLIPAADIRWSDLGSWSALYDLKASHPEENTTLSGQVRFIDSRGCLINVATERKVALVGVDNLVIVEKDGVLLIAERSKDQLVREISKSFETNT